MESTDRIVNNDAVISIDNKEDNVLMSHHTYKADEFLQRAGEQINRHKIDQWIIKGVPWKILSPNQNWQKGTIKICLEFVPEQPESVLDDIRQNIDNE